MNDISYANRDIDLFVGFFISKKGNIQEELLSTTLFIKNPIFHFMSRIYLFRHAQASYMSANYDKLSPKGEAQSAMLGEWIAEQNIQFDKVYRGPLYRHQQTMEIAGAKCGMTDNREVLEGLLEHESPATLKALMPSLIENDPIFKELAASMEKDPEQKKKYGVKIFNRFMEGWTTGKYHHPDYQDWQRFKEVVSECFENILADCKQGEIIGVFTSGGTVTAILSYILNLTDEVAAARLNVAIQNASTTELLFNQTNCSLFKFNQTHYLPKDFHTFV